jgi:hypothetical protein
MKIAMVAAAAANQISEGIVSGSARNPTLVHQNLIQEFEDRGYFACIRSLDRGKNQKKMTRKVTKLMTCMNDLKAVAIIISISVTVLVALATPFAFLLLLAGEVYGHEQYHWLSLVPLTVIVLLWVAVLRMGKRHSR